MRTRITVLLLAACTMDGATLKPESVQAWDRYVAAADAKMQKRANQNATFLWLDESADRRQRVRSGEIVVAENCSDANKKTPSAMIHDWMGAAFIPGAKIEDVLSVVRNYEGYKEYYPSTVVRSETISKSATDDRFSVLLMNQSLVVKTALASDYQSSFTQVSENRWFSKTVATRVQEIDDYGRASENRLPVGEGGGYIWRLASITRFEERDGGVYVELQVMALSRDVPLSLRFVIDPIIRRVSKNSLVESLKQTGKAVGERVATNTVLMNVASEHTRLAPHIRPNSMLGSSVINP